MSLTKRLYVGFGVVIFWVAVMTCLNGSQALLSSRAEARLQVSLEQLETASQMVSLAETMNVQAQLLSGSTDQDTLVIKLRNSLEANAVALAALVDTALEPVESGSEQATGLQSIKSGLAEYQQTAAGSLVAEAASEYKQSLRANHDAELTGLRSLSTLFLGINIVVGSLAFIASIAAGWVISRQAKRKLNEAASGIGTAASELMAVAAQVAASSAETAASTNETTVTVEEVRQAAMLAYEKASRMSEVSEGVAHTAEAGLASVKNTIAGIERMQSEIAVVVETIKRLSDKTQDVGEIVSAVNDLAEQTNLLSVNASIEAAKAGEFGQGFTVVAQEVKNLAQQSKQAVLQIRGILTDIQKATHTAVQAAENGGRAVEAGRGQSWESGEAIEALYASTEEVVQAAAQVSASSQQQLAGMDQIGTAIRSINEAGLQSVAGTKQVEQEVDHLKGLALSLKRLVDASAAG